MKAHGVPWLIRHLNGEISLAEAAEGGKNDTRRYTKRQFTWVAASTAGLDLDGAGRRARRPLARLFGLRPQRPKERRERDGEPDNQHPLRGAERQVQISTVEIGGEHALPHDAGRYAVPCGFGERRERRRDDRENDLRNIPDGADITVQQP